MAHLVVVAVVVLVKMDAPLCVILHAKISALVNAQIRAQSRVYHLVANHAIQRLLHMR